MNGAIRIVIVGPYRWKAFSVFNGNAYPPKLRSVVEACGSRLALLLLNTSDLRHALERDITDFKNAIESQLPDLETAVKRRPDLSSVVIYDSMALLAEIHNCFNALKSFLDLYAQLIGKLVSPPFEGSFGKANIDGQKVSGGRLVNALRNNGQCSSSQRLADLTLRHSLAWITTAVKYRDQLSHLSDLDDMRPLQLALHPSAPHIDLGELVRPAMPNGQDLEDYFVGLLDNLAEYVCASVAMLHDVDLKLLSPEKLMKDCAH
jgi:hypothetical protein